MKIWLILCLVLLCQYCYFVACEDGSSEELIEARCGSACAGEAVGSKVKGGGKCPTRPVGNKAKGKNVGRLGKAGVGGGSKSAEVQRGVARPAPVQCEPVLSVQPGQMRPKKQIQTGGKRKKFRGVEKVRSAEKVKQARPVQKARPARPVKGVKQQVKDVPVKRGPVRNQAVNCAECLTDCEGCLEIDLVAEETEGGECD